MKKACFLLAVLMVSIPVFAGDGGHNDVSLWLKAVDSEQTYFPWGVHTTDKGYYFEWRYNFDADHTFGAFVGKACGFELKGNSKQRPHKLTLIPATGVLVGDYEAFSPQFNLSYDRGRFNLFAMNQITFAGDDYYEFAYHWGAFSWGVGENWRLGFEEEVYYEYRKSENAEATVNLGPSAKYSFGKFYLKVWPTVSPTHSDVKKLFVGVGRNF